MTFYIKSNLDMFINVNKRAVNGFFEKNLFSLAKMTDKTIRSYRSFYAKLNFSIALLFQIEKSNLRLPYRPEYLNPYVLD